MALGRSALRYETQPDSVAQYTAHRIFDGYGEEMRGEATPRSEKECQIQGERSDRGQSERVNERTI